MIKQKKNKFKRLLIRIASVISIISVLLSCFCISVFAKDFYGYRTDYQPKTFYFGRGYWLGNDGGHNGTVISRSYRWSNVNNILRLYTNQTIDGYVSANLDTSGNYASPYAHYVIEISLANSISFEKGRQYDITFPVIFEWGPRTGQSSTNGVFLNVRMNKLSLMNNFGSSTQYYDFWFAHNSFVREDGRLDIVYSITPNRDFTADSFQFGINVGANEGTLSVKSIILSSPDLDPLSINDVPMYIMPDFTEQDNVNNYEDNLLQSGSSLFNGLDTFYSQIGTLGSNFDDLLKSAKAFSVLFDRYFGQGQLSLLLSFSLVLGLSAFIIGVIQTIGSWASGFASRSYGGYKRDKEKAEREEKYRRRRGR